MKYYTTIASLSLLSLTAVLLSLYFGSLSNKIEKNIADLNLKIKNLEEQIKINELEFVLHTNKKYLKDLQNIYLRNSDDNLVELNFIDLKNFKEKNMQNIFKISTE